MRISDWSSDVCSSDLLLWDVPKDDRPHQAMSDVALAFLEYDEELTWPEGSGITFTQHCAPKAWANGWRLGTQIDRIRKVVNEVRSEAGLPLATNWPMLQIGRAHV